MQVAPTLAPPDGSARSRAALGPSLVVGIALGAVAGALEGHLVLWSSALAFAEPGFQLARVELAYVCAAAACCAVLATVGRRTPRTAAAWTFALLTALVGAHWVRTEILPGAGLASWRALAAGALTLLAATICGRALARFLGATDGKRAHRLGLLGGAAAVVGLGHLAVAAWAPRPHSQSGLEGDDEALADSTSTAAEPLPDIVLLVVDTLRADHLGCYGYERPTSPVIDELAAEGALFEAAYSAAPWTRPAVASLMTGLYPSSHGVATLWGKLPADVPTLAGILKSRGYETAGFSANIQVSPTFGLDRSFDHFWAALQPTLLDKTAAGGWLRLLRTHLLAGWLARVPSLKSALPELGGTHAEEVNRVVFDWLARRDPARPLFLYVHYLDPHTPYAPPEDLLNEESFDVWALHREMDLPVQRRPYPLQEHRAVDPLTLARLQRLYDAEIRYCDRAIGRLLGRLRELGIDERDYVVLTADHGEEFYDHKQWLHGNSLFDEMVHVPLIVRGPGIQPQRVPELASHVDLAPTIAEWCGARVAFPTHGVSLARRLAGGVQGGAQGQRAVYFERLEPPRIQGIRAAQSKLVRIEYQGRETWMDFDLARDPGELLNAATQGQVTPEKRALLEHAGAQARALSRGAPQHVERDASVTDALRALGYVDAPAAPAGDGEPPK